MIYIILGILGYLALVGVLYLIAEVGTGGGVPKHPNNDEK
jgi:hypothetical protein